MDKITAIEVPSYNLFTFYHDVINEYTVGKDNLKKYTSKKPALNEDMRITLNKFLISILSVDLSNILGICDSEKINCTRDKKENNIKTRNLFIYEYTINKRQNLCIKLYSLAALLNDNTDLIRMVDFNLSEFCKTYNINRFIINSILSENKSVLNYAQYYFINCKDLLGINLTLMTQYFLIALFQNYIKILLEPKKVIKEYLSFDDIENHIISFNYEKCDRFKITINSKEYNLEEKICVPTFEGVTECIDRNMITIQRGQSYSTIVNFICLFYLYKKLDYCFNIEAIQQVAKKFKILQHDELFPIMLDCYELNQMGMGYTDTDLLDIFSAYYGISTKNKLFVNFIKYKIESSGLIIIIKNSNDKFRDVLMNFIYENNDKNIKYIVLSRYFHGFDLSCYRDLCHFNDIRIVYDIDIIRKWSEKLNKPISMDIFLSDHILKDFIDSPFLISKIVGHHFTLSRIEIIKEIIQLLLTESKLNLFPIPEIINIYCVLAFEMQHNSISRALIVDKLETAYKKACKLFDMKLELFKFSSYDSIKQFIDDTGFLIFGNGYTYVFIRDAIYEYFNALYMYKIVFDCKHFEIENEECFLILYYKLYQKEYINHVNVLLLFKDLLDENRQDEFNQRILYEILFGVISNKSTEYQELIKREFLN